MTTAINWTAAGLLALLLACAHLLDGPDVYEAEQAQFDSERDAINSEAASARFARAAQQVCGDNAGWRLVDENTIQCTTKRGKPTRRVSL